MTAYYNEIDPFAAAWLRKLIEAGLIAKGEVDERDIRDIKPSDLRGYTQCHFFAGIGVWSYALRQAGWPDSRPVWTGSCPCQPFSTAGKGAGTSDERHLWPFWFWLIEQCRPDTIFGEQVEAAIRKGWLDLVSDDLEGLDYSIAAIPFPACSVGAPHIRQRLYFVADSKRDGRHDRWGKYHRSVGENEQIKTALGSDDRKQAEECSSVSQLAESLRESSERGTRSISGKKTQVRSEGFPNGNFSDRFADGCETGRLGNNNNNTGPQGQQFSRNRADKLFIGATSLVSGFWQDAEWIYCRDEKYRPVEPGTFPLAHGSPNRVGRLRGYGNAIVAPQAQAFIESYMEICS